MESWKVNSKEILFDPKEVKRIPDEKEVLFDGKQWWVWVNGHTYRLQKITKNLTHLDLGEIDGNDVRSLMTGTITQILVREKEEVQKNQPVIKMEAMKMQYTLTAPSKGTVQKIHCDVGKVVEQDQLLLEIKS